MRVAAVQTSPRFGDVEYNLECARALLASTQADLYVLPELFSTGYLFADRKETAALAEPFPDGRTCAFLRALSSERRAVIVGGFAERSPDGRIHNAAAICDRGQALACYRKIHLFDQEFAWFDAGTEPPRVVRTSAGRLGTMICFDWIFPETMRCLALAGAQIVAHAANLVLPHCPDAMVTRCLENRVFAVTANRVGTDEREHGRLAFIGRSQITGTRGERLVQASPGGEEVITAEIDPARADDKQITPGNHLFADRRPGLYGRMWE
jgi:predicted amidohydrolase